MKNLQQKVLIAFLVHLASEADPFVKETVGDHVFNAYTEGKKAEWDEYRTKVSQWEIDRYMVNY